MTTDNTTNLSRRRLLASMPAAAAASRQLRKDIGLQIYDRYAGGSEYGVILEINLHPNLVHKHRELIDAVFVWAKELP